MVRGPTGGGGPNGAGWHAANGEDRTDVAVAASCASVAASCASGGAPVDLVAEGTVQRVGVGPDSSLTEIRIDRVLEGDAGDTVSIRTSSGPESASAGYVPRFEKGDRYRLRLQCQDDVYTTNVCLGTRPIE